MICRGDMLLRQISANKPALRRICTSAVVSIKGKQIFCNVFKKINNFIR